MPALSADCGVCARTLLAGESLRLFHDARADRAVNVCELCGGAALARGYVPVDAVERPSHRVRPSGSIVDSDDSGRSGTPFDPDADVLRRSLSAANIPFDEALLTDTVIRALVERMRLQESELDRVRRQVDPVRLAEEQRTLRTQANEIRQLRERLRQAESHVERLQQARVAESSPMRMCSFAVDAFNQSPQAERMLRIARTLDEPTVNVHDEGPGIPRRIRITLTWDIAWYEFVVKLDLGSGKASVHETGNGGDPRDVAREHRRANAIWRESGLVLR